MSAITKSLTQLGSNGLIELFERGGVTKAGAYTLIEELARDRRQPGQSEAQAFLEFITKDDLGRALYRLQKAMTGNDVVRPKVSTSVVRKGVNDIELTWNCLVAGIARSCNVSLSKAGDLARATPEGMAVWKAWHRPPIADTPPQSRGVGDAGRTPPQWRSDHSGGGDEDPERTVMDAPHADPAAALAHFMAIVEDLEVKYQLSQSQAMDKARMKLPELWKAAARLPVGERQIRKHRGGSDKWETLVNKAMRCGLSETKAIDAAMQMPGGKEAWLRHKDAW
jgi:hypothetical protein